MSKQQAVKVVPAGGKTKATATPKALAVVERAAAITGPMSVIERFAKDPSIDVGKLERLIEMQKDVMRVQAKQAFDAAFVALQADLPVVDKRGKILSKDKKDVRSRYAKLEDIQEAVKPICQKHGFAIRHRTEWPQDKPGVIRIVGILAHAGGHAEESYFDAPADRNDFRTPIQDMGSTVSYGRRYTTIDLLNITQRGVDNDGQGGTFVAERPPPPVAAKPTVDTPKAASPTRSVPPIIDATPVPAVSHHAASGDVITDPQIKRLKTILTNSGRTADEVKVWMKRRYGWESSRQITRNVYDEITRAIESPGDLPERVAP